MRPGAWIFAALAGLASTQAHAEIAFRGSYVWTEATNCRNERPGFDGTSVYHPNQPSNDFSGITTLHQFGGAGYTAPGAFTADFRNVSGVGLGWTGYTFDSAQLRITSQNPAQVTNKTQFVSLKGQIRSPGGDPGVNGKACIVTFSASYRRDPNA